MKYYTPKIEEFHVGFEYEENTLSGWNTKIMTWNDYPSYAGDYIGEGLQEDKIRVKHLDREDIESLGWEKSPNNRFIKTINDRIHICNNPISNKSNFVYFQPCDNLDTKEIDYSCMFFNIKNKSELKKLMEQLNIL